MVVEDCRQAGCLPIAAVGNDPGLRVALPAALDGVIGVSSLGARRTVPEVSWAGFLEAHALDSGNAGKLPNGVEVYPSGSSMGHEIDAYGPGVGVILEHEDGVLFDYVGTSYASPMVTGILALRLAADKTYSTKTGLDRTRYAEAALRSMCVPIRCPSGAFVAGLPQL
jgi:hypothetical protein